ncbi:MAG: MFS transporter [Hyphomicrobiales bacterium]|nr:MAG: MFS transporter [Hyphomicrobiales bacterium]
MGVAKTGWSELFSGGNGLRIAVLTSGVGLHAINVFISGTLMPSVVAEIGGLELFAWSTTLFIVASIVASIFAAIRPFGIGPRTNYIIAALTFGVGSLICGAAPEMWVMLLGRTVQGFGAGLLGALTYAMVRIIFPERLWARGMGLLSGVWGISTLVGPAIGGVFAEFGLWRWAFYILLPFAVLLALLALRVIPRRSDEAGVKNLPALQILLLIGAVMAISVASVTTGNLPLAAALTAGAVLGIVWLGRLERRGPRRLLPTGSFSFGSVLAPLLLMMLVMQLAITSDVFVPLFLQTLHGQQPLVAGYLVALMAVGWSTGSVTCSGWTGARARALLVAGPLLLSLGAIALALTIGRLNSSGDVALLVPVGLSLLAMGLGIGSTWPHMLTRLFQAAPEGEKDLTSAAITMVQLFASGLGAALGGVVVNLAGLTAGADPAGALGPAWWLYGLFALVPLIAIPLGLVIVRGEAARAVAQAAE